jgi:hypothetical protein
MGRCYCKLPNFYRTYVWGCLLGIRYSGASVCDDEYANLFEINNLAVQNGFCSFFDYCENPINHIRDCECKSFVPYSLYNEHKREYFENQKKIAALKEESTRPPCRYGRNCKNLECRFRHF